MSAVTVLIPNFNGAAYLGHALQSLLAQTYPDWVAVVGDNASTDPSADIAGATGDARVRLVRRPRNIGWVANVNLLLSEADSQFVAVLHSDDWWEPEFLETMASAMMQFPSALLASCSCALHGLHNARSEFTQHAGGVGPNQYLPPGEAVRYLSSWNRFAAPSVLARRSLFERVPAFDETLPGANDWLMWLRAAALSGAILVPRMLANYRIHDDNLTATAKAQGWMGSDSLRLEQTLRHEWRTQEPYPGAIHAISRSVALGLLAGAQREATQRHRNETIYMARLSRAVAPDWSSATVAITYAWAIRALGVRTMARVQPLTSRVARSRLLPAPSLSKGTLTTDHESQQQRAG